MQVIPEKTVAEQRATYAALLQGLGKSTFAKVQEILDERESIEPEPGLTPATIEKLQQKIAGQRK